MSRRGVMPFVLAGFVGVMSGTYIFKPIFDPAAAGQPPITGQQPLAQATAESSTLPMKSDAQESEAAATSKPLN